MIRDDITAGGVLAFAAGILACLIAALAATRLWFPIVSILGLLVTGLLIWGLVECWRAWLRSERHRLGTTIRQRRADLDHERARALLDLDVERMHRSEARARVTTEKIQDAVDEQVVAAASRVNPLQIGGAADAG